MRSGTQVFTSRSSYAQALLKLGDQRGGPAVLAIAAADIPALPERHAKRESSWHRHIRGHVSCVEEGIVRLRTEGVTLVATPNRAVWIPPGKWHAAVTNAVTYSWNLFLSSQASKSLPDEPCIIEVSNLLDTLVDKAVQWTNAASLAPRDRRLMTVLLDELEMAPQSRGQLVMPEDRRLKRIAEALLQDPASSRTRDEWAVWAGLSSRTLSRRFQEEVHMSFAHWRDQALLMAATERLSHGESVGSISDALGYATPSSFIAMFRRHFGISPLRYVKAGVPPNASE